MIDFFEGEIIFGNFEIMHDVGISNTKCILMF